MTYPIEHNIPIPPRWEGRQTRFVNEHGKYRWAMMGIGDSFLVLYDLEPPETVRQRVLAASGRYARRNNTGYTSRLEQDGVRIWRVA